MAEKRDIILLLNYILKTVRLLYEKGVRDPEMLYQTDDLARSQQRMALLSPGIAKHKQQYITDRHNNWSFIKQN